MRQPKTNTLIDRYKIKVISNETTPMKLPNEYHNRSSVSNQFEL